MSGTSDTNDWIYERFLEIEQHKDHCDVLPFRIIALKDAGFLAKVKGLYAYISFYHMPWKYYTPGSWVAIAPSLIGKEFSCKIHKVDKDQNSILLDGALPQFKQAVLTIGEVYNGLVIQITDAGLIIDIGCHFDWKYGSLTGFLHASKFVDNAKVSDFTPGQEITTVYQKAHDHGQLIFCSDKDKYDWQMGIPQALVGQKMWAKVIRRPGSKKVDLLVRGKYKAKLEVDKQTDAPSHKRKIKKLKNELSDGGIIHCTVTGLNKKHRTLLISWPAEPETDVDSGNSILNHLDNETKDILANLKNKT